MSNIPLGLIALFILGPLTLVAIWLVYIVQAYTEKAEALLPNSHFVKVNKSAFFHMGIIGKVLRSGVLTMVLIMPALSVKRGIVDATDVEKFPNDLKRMLVISWGLGWLLSIALMIFGTYLKYIE
ncbi:hypothetical protein [Pseudomonas sp. GM55]|uniref:hypothetical protein n=1 Tax=Pseudomonas sp. GM55 TaxID=1144333 RepID=UPI0005BE8FB4|nr:hypothetical protein [Pseudomonas sp. GM55]